MQKKSRTYHESAVVYNRVLAEAAEGLVLGGEIEDPTVSKWVEGIGRQHRFHQSAHEKAVQRLEEASVTVEVVETVETVETVEEKNEVMA